MQVIAFRPLGAGLLTSISASVDQRNRGDTSRGHGPRRGVLATSASDAPAPAAPRKVKSLGEILSNSAAAAARGGTAGAIAMASQVLGLMWMRTTINYQYRYGTGTMDAFRALYKDGGIPRFYRGLAPALIQGPLSRFGDTAANTGAIELLNSFESTSSLPIMVKTAAASFLSGMFRVTLMPVDTLKTTMQVEGKDGIPKLMAKFRANGPTVFFSGAMAAWAANTVGHYPWFAVYNYLSEVRLMYSRLSSFALRCTPSTSPTSLTPPLPTTQRRRCPRAPTKSRRLDARHSLVFARRPSATRARILFVWSRCTSRPTPRRLATPRLCAV